MVAAVKEKEAAVSGREGQVLGRGKEEEEVGMGEPGDLAWVDCQQKDWTATRWHTYRKAREKTIEIEGRMVFSESKLPPFSSAGTKA